MATKKSLDFNFEFTGIDEKPYHDMIGFNTQGQEVHSADPIKANEWLGKKLFMSSDSADDYLKSYEWAISLKKVGKLELDTSDTKKLEEFIKKIKDVPVFIRYQIMDVFNKK